MTISPSTEIELNNEEEEDFYYIGNDFSEDRFNYSKCPKCTCIDIEIHKMGLTSAEGFLIAIYSIECNKCLKMTKGFSFI